jgi:hypothetical protein
MPVAQKSGFDAERREDFAPPVARPLDRVQGNHRAGRDLANAIARDRTQARVAGSGRTGSPRSTRAGQVPNFSRYLCATQPDLITALARDPGELALKAYLVLRRNRNAAIATDYAEFANGDFERPRFSDRPPVTDGARPPLEPNGAAFGTRRQRRRIVLAASAVSFIFCSTVLRQCPLNRIVDPCGRGFSTRFCICLAGQRPQYAPDHLSEQPQ